MLRNLQQHFRAAVKIWRRQYFNNQVEERKKKKKSYEEKVISRKKENKMLQYVEFYSAIRVR